MSDLTPSFITLDQGLNLHVPKIAAPPGTILNMLNYEQVDFQGQKRIDGYVRYDGSLGSYQDNLYSIRFTGSYFNEGDILYSEQDELMGVVVGVDGDSITAALVNDNLYPVPQSTISGQPILEVTKLSDLLDPLDQYEAILEANDSLRQRTTELPGPVAGLHWFNDRLYAVASVSKIEVGGGNYPNETYNGLPILKVDGDYIYVGDLVEDAVGSDLASLYQSRTEQQALDELGDANMYGWDFVHQGWVVPFEEGSSLYGSLIALNHNRKGVGVQGPTSIDGSNGKPLVISQKAQITDMPTQVNGWKTSDSRTTYNLDVHALDVVDNWSVYADAFFSWDGETGAVTATGINSGALIEYSPSATIEVEV